MTRAHRPGLDFRFWHRHQCLLSALKHGGPVGPITLQSRYLAKGWGENINPLQESIPLHQKEIKDDLFLYAGKWIQTGRQCLYLHIFRGKAQRDLAQSSKAVSHTVPGLGWALWMIQGSWGVWRDGCVAVWDGKVRFAAAHLCHGTGLAWAMITMCSCWAQIL